MADSWYYRMFDQEFGPVPFEELKQLAELGSIAAADEVRSTSSSTWQTASFVSELGLSAGKISTDLRTMPTVAVANPGGADDWYCMFHGQELGPLNFEDIAAFVEEGQLGASDEVRLGANGKWRRVGSIGRLMALLPYLAGEHQIPDSKQLVVPAPQPVPAKPVSSPAVEIAKSNPVEDARAALAAEATASAAAAIVTAAETGLAQAQAAQGAANHSAGTLIFWALAPHVDPAWWGWIGGVEYGPTGFIQVLEWAKAGRIQETDFLKNGMYGQYVPATNVPGLFNAVAMMKQAADAVAAAQASLEAARAAVPPTPVAPTPMPVVELPKAVVETPKPAARKSAPNLEAVSAPVAGGASETVKTSPTTAEPEKPIAANVPAKPAVAATPIAAAASVPAVNPPAAVPDPRPMTSTMSSSSGFSSSASSSPRPVAAPPRPAPRSTGSSSSFSIGELMAGPAGKGILAVVAVALLGAGWMFFPASYGKDIERYQNLKTLLDDIKSARASKQTNFDSFKSRATKLTAEYAPILKAEASVNQPQKQCLLWACRDELPRMMSGDLTQETPAERNIATRLKEAADYMRLPNP